MAQAGVVGMAEVIVPNSATSRSFSGSPAMWSFTWVAAAAIFLVLVNMAIVGRSMR